MSKVRVDKWLWAVRIFKSRTIASTSCKSNNVKVNDKNAKASTEVDVGDIVRVSKNGFNFEFEIVKIIAKRVGAALAVECYKNVTSEEELNKYQSWFAGKARAEIREKGVGRPTKKERRVIEDYKDSYLELDWEDDD